MLSGVLLNTALYGVLRVYIIAKAVIPEIATTYLICFGLLSIIAIVPFVFVQHDLKRLLAFSSVEHIGIITLAMGVGGSLKLYGGLLHMVNHSLGKSLLFLLPALLPNNITANILPELVA